MGLCRIVYLSKATKPMSHRKLEALVERCSVRNHANGISGLLLHSGGNFIQVLEGDSIRVPSLYTKICRDPRHTGIRTLVRQAAASRLFPDWGMQLANTGQMKSVDHAAINKILLRLRLASDASAVAQSQAIALLQEFRRQLMDAA